MPEVKGRLITPRLASAPSSPTAGELYYDTAANILYGWNGTSWVNLMQSGGGASIPAGLVQAYAGSAAPSGWLLCDGSIVSRTTYAALFTAIGTAYGAGDGSTTFGLPDLRGRVIVGKAASGTFVTLGATGGEETHVLLTAEMAGHTHTFTGTALGTHQHVSTAVFTGSAMGTHQHVSTAAFTGSALAGHAHGSFSTTPSVRYANNATRTAGSAIISNVGELSGGTDPNTGTPNTTSVSAGTPAGTVAMTNPSVSAGTPAGTVAMTNPSVSAGTPAGTNSTTGSDTAHNNLQPYSVLNHVIKT